MARRREPRSRQKGRPSAARSESTRRKIRLATLGTAIGIVTSFVTIALGAFDLREKVSPVDAKDTGLTSSTYVQGVAEVCDERENSQIARRADALELKRRMKRALELPQQRLLVLEFANGDLERGDHALSVFAGLTAPSELIVAHRAVRLRWEGNVDRLRVHRDRVEESATRTRLVTVLDRLNRSLVETESRRVEAGLRKLGGNACDIGLAQPTPVVNLPPPDRTKGPDSPPRTGDLTAAPSADPDLVSPDPSADPNAVPPDPVEPQSPVPNTVPPHPVNPASPVPNTVPPHPGAGPE